MQKDKWSLEHIPLSDILLDPDNIRLDITGRVNQNALLADLFNNERAMQLVSSIIRNGLFPNEFPIVIKQNEKYIVIAGNRRIAALKAIQNPDVIPNFTKEIKNIERLEGIQASIQSVRVVIAPSHQSVRKLLATRHTENTRRPWRPLRQAYFYKTLLDSPTETWTIERLQKEFPEDNVYKFIRMLEIHKVAKSLDYPPEIASIVHDERKFLITTLERVCDNHHAQVLLGFSFNDDGTFRINGDKKSFEKYFRIIVQDIALKNENSRSLNSDDMIKEYIQSLVNESL